MVLFLTPIGTVAYTTAFPYGRPEVALASRDVLQQRRPGDVVWGNSTEQMYYFRSLGDEYVSYDRLSVPRTAPRAWIVLTGKTPELREDLLRSLLRRVGNGSNAVSITGQA